MPDDMVVYPVDGTDANLEKEKQEFYFFPNRRHPIEVYGEVDPIVRTARGLN
jgi:hypothetical protein